MHTRIFMRIFDGQGAERPHIQEKDSKGSVRKISTHATPGACHMNDHECISRNFRTVALSWPSDHNNHKPSHPSNRQADDILGHQAQTFAAESTSCDGFLLGYQTKSNVHSNSQQDH